MICSQCGTELPDNAKFCFSCGKKVESEVTVNEETVNKECETYDGISLPDADMFDDDCSESVFEDAEENTTGAVEESDILNQQQANTVFVYKRGQSMIQCPKCGTNQSSDRDNCYRCGVRFVDTQDYGMDGQSTYVPQSNEDQDLSYAGSGYGNDRPSSQLSDYQKNDIVAVQDAKPAVYSGSFVMTKKISNVMEVDEKRRLVKFIAHGASVLFGFKEKERIYRYQDIIGYELIENSGSVTKGGLGGAVAGGLMFGGAGAVAGSVIGKKSHYMCHDMSVRVTVNDPDNPMVSIPLLPYSVRTNSILYKSFREIADSIISQLQYICSLNESDRVSITATPAAPGGQISAADEILKFKNLLDAGIITQAEFEKKKRELLGM